MNNTIIFIKHNDPEFDSVKSIRSAVFIDEQGANSQEEFDSYDEKSDFAVLYEGSVPVGTARIARTDKGVKIGRIAILKACRGKGYGADIVRAVTQKAFMLGVDTVYVDAQNYAVPFYEKLGFTVIGSELIDRGLPHIPMSIKQNEIKEK